MANKKSKFKTHVRGADVGVWNVRRSDREPKRYGPIGGPGTHYELQRCRSLMQFYERNYKVAITKEENAYSAG